MSQDQEFERYLRGLYPTVCPGIHNDLISNLRDAFRRGWEAHQSEAREHSK